MTTFFRLQSTSGVVVAVAVAVVVVVVVVVVSLLLLLLLLLRLLLINWCCRFADYGFVHGPVDTEIVIVVTTLTYYSENYCRH